MLNLLNDLFAGELALMVIGVEVIELIDNLPLFHASMTDGGQKRFPVPESILAQNSFLIRRFHQVRQLQPMTLGIGGDQLFAL